MDTPKRKGGRPPKSAAGAKRAYLRFRVTEAMREHLAQIAALEGRSISEEVEHRLLMQIEEEKQFYPYSAQKRRAISEIIRTVDWIDGLDVDGYYDPAISQPPSIQVLKPLPELRDELLLRLLLEVGKIVRNGPFQGSDIEAAQALLQRFKERRWDSAAELEAELANRAKKIAGSLRPKGRPGKKRE